MAVIAIIKAYLQAHNARLGRWRQQLERPRHENNDPTAAEDNNCRGHWVQVTAAGQQDPAAILRPSVCSVQVCGHLTAHIGNYLHIGTRITHTKL